MSVTHTIHFPLPQMTTAGTVVPVFFRSNHWGDSGPSQLSFSTMEEKGRGRLQSDAAASEPECEIHFSNEQRELQGHLDNISSLQDLFVKQSQTLALIEPDIMEHHERAGRSRVLDKGNVSRHHRDASAGSFTSCLTGWKSIEESFDVVNETLEYFTRENGREISPTSVVTMGFFDNSYLDGIDKHLDFEEADDIDSSVQQSSLEGSYSEIQAAINEIRKEASQIDIVMALDQLKTVETELEVVTRALKERSLEIDDLRHQLRKREERISRLELELDLNEADASKLRADLKTCIDRMFDISAVAGTSALVDTSVHMADIERIRDQAIIRPSALTVDVDIPSRPHSEAFDEMNDYDIPREEEWLPVQEYHFPISKYVFPSSEPKRPVVAKAFPIVGARDSRSVYRESPNTCSPTRSFSMFSASTRSLILESPSRRRSSSEVIQNSIKVTSEDEDTGQDHRMCGLFRRRQQKPTITMAKDFAAMRSKIDQLHMMMKVSLETSEKLRKRLSLISRYYDGIIGKLQRQVIEIKAEKAELKANCNSKISAVDYEKRVAIMHLENKLRERERQITGRGDELDATPYEI